MSQKYYLIEDFDPALDYRDGIAVALNPLPQRALYLRKIPYQIMEDFYSEKELRAREGEFFDRQLAWIGRIDLYAKEHIEFSRKHSIALARAYYNRIKYFTDAVIIQSFILNSIVEKIGKENEIIYIKKQKNLGPKTMHHFKFDESSLCFSDLLPQICKKHGVSYFFHFLDGSQIVDKNENAYNPKLTAALKHCAKNIRHLFKYRKFDNWISRIQKKSSLKILFLHSGSFFLDPVITDFMKQGARVFLRVDKNIRDLAALNEKAVLHIPQPQDDAEEKRIKEDCLRASQEFAGQGRELLDWINSQCGIDVSEFILPYFQSFFENSCFEMLKEARNLAEFYKRGKVDYVLTHTNSDLTSKSAIIAARLVPSVKTVGIQHGCDVFFDRVMHMTEIDPFDYYFTAESLSEKKFRVYAKAPFVSSAEIYQSPHYLQVVKSRCAHPNPLRVSFPRKRESMDPRLKHSGMTKGERKKILYIPTKLASVHTRYFNCMVYPILWYLEFQKKLFEYFAQKSDRFDFVYKQPMIRTKFVEETVIPYLREKNYSNIIIETKPVMDCFRDADAVIMDRPTTAFPEALMSGLPVLALYPDFIENMIAKDEAAYFGKSCQSFSSPEDAFAKIDIFLKGNSSEYTPKLPIHDDGLVEVLTQQKQKKEKKSSRVVRPEAVAAV